MKVSDLLVYLENLLKPSLFRDYCPNGLQLGNENDQISKIAFGVTADLETIEQAIAYQANVLVTHHGILWNADSLPIVGRKKIRIEKLLQSRISLISYHLPLDAHNEIGNNWKVARDLNWNDLCTFGSLLLPIGVAGTFDPISIEDFQSLLSKYYQSHPIGSVLGGKRIVSSAAIMSGGAYKEIDLATRLGYDCFITGNYDEPAWSIAMEEKINFFAYGHTITERIGITALSEKIEKKFGLNCKVLVSTNLF